MTKKRISSVLQSLLSVTVALGVLAGCSLMPQRPTATPVPSAHVAEPGTPTGASSGTTSTIGSVEEEGMKGIRFTIGEGVEQAEPWEVLPVGDVTPLSREETERLLARLPQLTGDSGDQQAFRLPAESLPAPRPGETLQETFPPMPSDERPPEVAAAPIEVLRYSPEGDVPLAPYLSITFDQPMVPLTSHEDLAAKDVPVKLQPQPEGVWRWVGTKTLMFEPVTRFPMATEYVATVPAGTLSATGGTLEEELSWSFSTPPPTMTSSYPVDGPTVRDPLLFVAFDQRVAPAAVLATIDVSAGKQSYGLKLATDEDLAADEQMSLRAERAGEGRWLAFYLDEMLPYDTTVTVSVGPGTPSAEGPRITQEVQSFSFRTYGPLRVEESDCAHWYGDDTECTPMAPWYLRFSNPLDEQAFDAAQVQIEPELPGKEVWVSGNHMTIRGASKGRTTYKVTLAGSLLDVYGQTLGDDTVVKFTVGSARSTLVTPSERFVVLDPASLNYPVYSINYGALKVSAYAVEPEDWPAFQAYLTDARRNDEPGDPPGRKVLDKILRPDGETDTLIETAIDLAPALPGGTGHLILVVEPQEGLLQTLRRTEAPPVLRIWVQATRIALDAFADGREMLAWANDMSDGAPLSGAEITLWPDEASSVTDAQGLATLPLGADTIREHTYLMAKLDGETALLPQSSYAWGGNWSYGSASDEYRWYVFDDRQMYRPGEQTHIKGWVRLAQAQRGSSSLALPGQGMGVYLELHDARGNVVYSNEYKLNALGGFDATLDLPINMNLGQAGIRLVLTGAPILGASHEHVHAIQVQEFRRPEFEVSASVSSGPHMVGDQALATVEASYYAGGALPNAEVNWMVAATPGSYTPPNWDDFSFGMWVPWWRHWEMPYEDETERKYWQGVTDAAGKHVLAVDFISVEPPRPVSYSAEATVMDVNRQAWTATTQWLVHPAAFYVGLRSERTFVEQGEPILLDAIVTDLDGAPQSGVAIDLRTVRLHWTWEKGEWVEQELDEQLLTLTSGEEPVSGRLNTPQGGTYRITATVTDAQGRRNLTEITRWVSGGTRPSSDKVEQEEVLLIPDRAEYQPGDVAEILVQAPFVPAEGLLSVRRDGLVSTERFSMDGPSYKLEVPIKEGYLPNVHVQVDLVGAADRLDANGEADERLPKRPAYASGTLNLAVPAYQRTLEVDVTPRERELAPGESTTLDIRLKDATGAPVGGAELAVVVVDEAVLALSNYQLADPINVFYSQRPPGVSDYHLRGYVQLADPQALLENVAGAAQPQAMATQVVAEMEKSEETVMRAAMPTAEGALDADEAASGAIRVRENLAALATFQPNVPTDADGTASVVIELPDNLTRYRVMVVAVADATHYGKGESTLTARLPLMVRPSAPRFLNFGDALELPVVLQNQTDAPLDVRVAVQATNLALGEDGLAVTVPANDRLEVRFLATTISAGTARVLVGAAAGEWGDAAQIELPVYTPATTEAFATYGTVAGQAGDVTSVIAQPVIAPSDVYTQFGGLEITTSSTALQALTDAVLYLVAYPYECSEQLASRILAVAALRDVLTAFDAEGLPEPDVIVTAVQHDIAYLQQIQNWDGGFPVWQRGKDSWPFHSIHATHALVRARDKGFEVPEEMLSSALGYLRDIERHYPDWYGASTRNTLTAYALYVRTQMGDVDTKRARDLVDQVGVDELSFEALGWLLQVMADDARSASQVDAIMHYLGNRVTETAGAANFVTDYREQEQHVLLSSNRRADGVLLEALLHTEPENDLIPKLVSGLLAHRKRGRWGNTQENVFILLALDRYFQVYEAQTPDFVARAWLGDQYLAEFQFEGRTTDYQQVTVPMSYLAEREGLQDLVLSKQGDGRLYYRLGIRYAPTDLKLEPTDQGFVVERVYEAVDDPADVRLDDQGVWHIKAGARVRVRLTLVATSRRYHVALVDRLPAGLEPMNPALAVTGSIPQDPSDEVTPRYWWWNWTWYEHQNLRDERAEAFASLLWDGIHTYTYVARATTPGTFVAPPTKAEEMYSPEVFGRSASDWVVVE